MLKLTCFVLCLTPFINGQVVITNQQITLNGDQFGALQQLNLENVIPQEDIELFLQYQNSEIDVYKITAVVNEFADKIFGNIQKLMVNNNLTSVEMPEIHASFHILLVTGHIDLTRGEIKGIATIHRGGDVVVTYDQATKIIEVRIPITFDTLHFQYDFSATLLGIGPNGDIEGGTKDVTALAVITFDVKNLVAKLEKLQISSGHLEVDIHSGNPLVDTVINILVNVVTTVLKPVIILVIDQIVGSVIRAVVDGINSAIGSILHPTEVALFILNNIN